MLAILMSGFIQAISMPGSGVNGFVVDAARNCLKYKKSNKKTAIKSGTKLVFYGS